ncbi:MAG: hypothetical protein ACPLRP_05195 [Candidatus Bipolaricaulaceae bacterium]
MIFLLLFALPALALEVGVEVGWAGRAVVSAVNPLWLSLENLDPQPFSGAIRVSAGIGSPWRGEARYTAELPVFLAPFGRTRLVLPWPVPLGMTSLRVEVFAESGVVFARDFPLNLSAERLRAGLGPPPEPVDVLLSPLDFPTDPLLLWPFSKLFVGVPLSAGALAAVRAWAAFLGGTAEISTPCSVSFSSEAFFSHLRGQRPSPPLWSALVPGLLLYLFGLGPVLSRFARGNTWVFLGFLVVFLAFSLFYGVFRETVAHIFLVFVDVECKSVDRFCLELCGAVSRREEAWGLPGFWVEVLPARGWEGLDVRWVYTPEGWRTEAGLTPGRPRFFLRLAEKPGPELAAEPSPPPNWLTQVLRLPWEEARVQRALLSQKGHETEVWRVLLP